MKNSTFTFTSLILLIFLIAIVSLPVSHCRNVILPMDSSLINTTCHQTPNFKLCRSLFQSDPRSFNAKDAQTLASIMVDIVLAKASQTVDKIDQLAASPGGDQAALATCSDNYTTVTDDDLPQASEALSNDDNQTAEDRLKDITFQVDECDQQFSGPELRDLNKATHDAASIAAAIADKLP